VVNPSDLSAMAGQRRCSTELLRKEFGLKRLKIVGGEAERGSVALLKE